MKTNLISATAGFIAGLIIFGIAAWNMAPGMMMLEDQIPYGFDEAVEKFELSTKENGWKIPTVHDLQKTMKKFGKDVRPVKVFELCHPEHAGRILAANEERIVSSLMPCRVALYEKSDGKVYASRMNTSLMASMMDGIIPEVMDTASVESENILSAILNK